MLARMCPILPWRKRLVTIVQGLASTPIGINPKNKISSGTTQVAINSSKFSPIKAHIGVKLNPR